MELSVTCGTMLFLNAEKIKDVCLFVCLFFETSLKATNLFTVRMQLHTFFLKRDV